MAVSTESLSEDNQSSLEVNQAVTVRIQTHTHTHTHTRAHTHTHMPTQIYARTRAHARSYVHCPCRMWTSVCMCMCVCVCVLTQVNSGGKVFFCLFSLPHATPPHPHHTHTQTSHTHGVTKPHNATSHLAAKLSLPTSRAQAPVPAVLAMSNTVPQLPHSAGSGNVAAVDGGVGVGGSVGAGSVRSVVPIQGGAREGVAVLKFCGSRLLAQVRDLAHV